MINLLHHECGFFSCCSVKLFYIIQYYNKIKILPEVNSTHFYVLYQTTKDITFDFFKPYIDRNVSILNNSEILIDRNCYQFTDYNKIDYSRILPFVDKYFSPSDEILQIQTKLKKTYNILPENTIAVYYRGTDKKNETMIDSFESYYNKTNDILKGSSMQILIQSDSTDFVVFMKKHFPNAIVIIENDTSTSDKGIHNEKSKEENYKDIKNLFPTFLILSECKHLICGSSNGSIWMTFYRGNTINVHQNLNQKWLY